LRFHHHPELALAMAEDAESGSAILLAGSAVHVENGATDLEALARELLAQRLRGETRLFDFVDRLSGRFVLVVHADGAVRVLHDACGMKTLFYDADHACAGSHAELVAQHVGAPERPAWQEWAEVGLLRRGSAGLETPFEGVRFLTPNTLLDLSARCVERYFPRADLRPRTLDEASEIVRRAATVQVESLFRSRDRVLCGLTGGLDTRTTLALLGPHRDRMTFMTYRSEKAGSIEDADCATRIARVLHLDHEVFELRPAKGSEEASAYDEFAAIYARNTLYRRRPRVAFQFFRRYRGKFDLLLKSHLGEISRAPSWYHHRLTVPEIRSGRDMAALHGGKKGGSDPGIRAAFDDFYARTHFDDTRNFHRIDLFYWEHRMGTWASTVAMEGDPAFDTHLLLNARAVLTAMLGVSLPMREKAALFHQIIADSLPELAELPLV